MAYLQGDPPLPPMAELFPYLEKDLREVPEKADPFTVTTENGFLPTTLPLTDLPSEFEPLAAILQRMPICTEEGKPGLLAEFKLGPLIDESALPNLTAEVEILTNKDMVDLPLVTALFRDYSFLASAYVLEPCWESWSKDQNAGYGLGRPLLPKCIAGPLARTAKV